MASDDGSVTSSGLVAGDNPIHHALLLLILQVGIIILLSRSLGLLLRAFKQPRVVAGIKSSSRLLVDAPLSVRCLAMAGTSFLSILKTL